MFKQIIFPILLIALLPLVLKLMIRLRLGIALVYIALANTLLMDWATAHVTLSNAILGHPHYIVTGGDILLDGTPLQEISEDFGALGLFADNDA